MDPKQLLSQLMKQRNLNPTSLSKATGNATKQSQIHRFLAGDVKEPRRSTLQPVAAALKIPVEALLDERVAADVASHLWPSDGAVPDQRVHPIRVQPARHRPTPLDAQQVVSDLSEMLESIPEEARAIAADQLKTLVMAPDSAKARAALVKTLEAAPQAEHSKRHGT